MRYDFSDRNEQLGALYAAHLQATCERYDHALEKAGAAHAVVFSGAPHPVFLDDNYYPFRSNAHFLAWGPLTNLPFSYVVYTPGEQPRLIYNQPEDYWHVVPDDPDGYWTDHFDIHVIHTPEQAAPLLPTDRDKCVLIGELLDQQQAFDIDRVNPATILNILHYARGRKTDYELACMRLASRRGATGHIAAAAAYRDGQPEFGIHRAYCEAVSHSDNELPYGNIIALNEHAAVLHYTNLDRSAPAESRSFLIDAGAQVHGYASDITRTYSNGDAEFDALIDGMEQLQQDVAGRVRAGTDFRDLHMTTHELIAGLLAESGIATGSADALIGNGITAAFYPHGLGHLLGIQVHDVGGHMQDETGINIDPPSGHPYLRLTRVLEPDMVLTIEPGLYFIDMLLDNLRGADAEAQVNWKAVDRLKPYGGIRIEDNVRVLDGGSENLTRDAFAEIA